MYPTTGLLGYRSITAALRNAQCGTKKCGPEQQCFVHRISALQSTYQFLGRMWEDDGRWLLHAAHHPTDPYSAAWRCMPCMDCQCIVNVPASNSGVGYEIQHVLVRLFSWTCFGSYNEL